MSGEYPKDHSIPVDAPPPPAKPSIIAHNLSYFSDNVNYSAIIHLEFSPVFIQPNYVPA